MATVPSLTLDPPFPSLRPGQTQYITGIFRDSGGRQIMDGNAGVWTTSDPTIVTVDPSGTAKGVGPGTATVSETIGSFVGTATVTVYTVS